ncbi:MAG TPA: hypothetical protein P5235_05760 [Saprospiraceae bacterium]|nr:hypothetical protein [Saprospiraceae bacterium]HRX28869.1 hypothetical protein [Saprospiraceae bacterium]
MAENCLINKLKTMHLGRILVIDVAMLSISFIAMQFTEEVHWTMLDFVVMGILLFITGVFIDYFLMYISNPKKKFLYVIAALIVFGLIWVELAVGII